MKPNKTRIKKWVAALRSGKYQQATNRLSRKLPDGKFGYCCLGVAQLVCRREGGPKVNLAKNFTLTHSVAKWFGIGTNPRLGGSNAAYYNDTLEENFSQIADRIEKEFLSKKS